MKIVGVIAEYNPFHQGHAYHLARARELSEADCLIAVMSGNYVQRGVPAMFDKYIRAEAALRGGADLVLELPPCIATGSAEYFASGAVRLLCDTGIVTDLCFGSECGDLNVLEHTAGILAEEPAAYQDLLRQQLKAGHPYPKARALALHAYDPDLPCEYLEEPNNLLGIEYLKALKKLSYPMQVHTVQRCGASYHEQKLDSDRAGSASGIRQALLLEQGNFTSQVTDQLPSAELYGSYHGRPPLTEDAFSLLLLERLRRHEKEDFSSYFDVTEELSNRIHNCLDDFRSFSQFTDLLKTRNLTRTAVSRALLHILLNIRSFQPAGAFRVLGFRQDAKDLLTLLAGQGQLPLITGLTGQDIGEDWLYADRLYESVRSLLHNRPYENEYRRKMLVIR